jgi:site-specific DNA-methyltransferase (cytosine-N4-specific)
MLESIKINWVVGEDWDFAGEDTQYLTHGLHPYPARMVPQIAKKLLGKLAQKGEVVLDPFCGSGGVLAEARLAGLNSIGIDINPLACLLAEVKSNPIDPAILERYWKRLKTQVTHEITQLHFRKTDVEPPKFPGTNIEYWFKPETMKKLTIIRKSIEAIEEDQVRRFFEVPFSLTVRDVSGVRKKEYKLYRLPEEEWKRYSPDVLGTFTKHVDRSIGRMREFYYMADRNVFSKVFLGDTRTLFTEKFTAEGNIFLKTHPPNIIITSPPYGDSKTTVAYGQFSRLSSLWLDFEPDFKREAVMNVDRLSLGGEPAKQGSIHNDLPTLEQTIEMIKSRDEKRAAEVLAYFLDLYTCVKKMYEVLDDGGYCCIVVANRTVRRISVPTHAIITEMGVKVGFVNDVTIIPRTIPSKRLPWENAPENIPGLKGKTMSRENIVIMRKR